MFSKIYSAGIVGVDGFVVDVEVDISRGLPCFNVIGLPDASIREARDRIKSAIVNSGYEFVNSRIVVNLAPADIKKEGSIFDVAMAIGILNKKYNFDDDILKKSMFLGELSLDGNIKPIKGSLSIVINAKEMGFENVFIPTKNLKEALLVKDIKIFPVENLHQLVDFLLNNQNINFYEREDDICIYDDIDEEDDFDEVKGNLLIKRACEICAAGGHNLLMVGPPGSGKTMIAKRMKSILPKMNHSECIESTKIYSVCGLLKDEGSVIKKRPFRSPHHTCTKTALIGGGTHASAGEVALAHNGVLFLDELTEFDKKNLETLRQPIEDKYVNIARVKKSIKYKTDFLLVGAMNPCKCGYYGSTRTCKCSSYEVRKYLNKLSGPLLDRFDIIVQVDSLNYDEFENVKSESSNEIRKRVDESRGVQENRYKNEKIDVNSQMTSKHVDKYCKLDLKCKQMLKNIFNKYNLSSRSYYKILKISRTIADLDKSEKISINHICEAISFKKTYFYYWES